MKVELEIIPELEETTIQIRAPKLSADLEDLILQLQSRGDSRPLLGEQSGRTLLLKGPEILRVYAERGAVFADTDRGIVRLKLRLYEAERQLPAGRFVRISNSEIVNFERVESFDLSMSGTILIRMENGSRSWVSRRYVQKIREVLGLQTGARKKGESGEPQK